MKPVHAIFVLAILVVVGVVACSPATPTSPTSAPAAGKPAAGATTAPAAPAATTAPASQPAASGAAAGKPLVFGIWSAPKTFNPWVTNDSYSWAANDMMYAGLTRLDAEGKPSGALAERWEVSPDGKVYTFHLRQNAKWHDGRPVTAEDAVFTLTTILDPKVKSVWASRFATIKGAADFKSGSATGVAGLEAVNASTFRITLDAPSAPLLGLLAVQTPIMPKHLLGQVAPDQLEQNPFFQKPVGNGPFKFVQYQSGQYVEYDAFDDFYLGKPGFQKLFLRVGTEDVLQAQLQRGEVDVTAVSPAEANRVKGLSGVTLVTYPSSIVQAININLEKPYLQDIRVRQAIAHALDKTKMVNTLLGTMGSAIDTPVASPQWAVTKEVSTYAYDPEKAKSLLREAGWDSSRRLLFRYPTGNKPREDAATLIQQSLKAVGIEVELKISDFATMTSDAEKGNFDLLLIGNQTTYDPDYIASQYTSNTWPPAGVNYMRYKNSRVDELLGKGKTTPAIEDRALIYKEFQSIVTQELPKVFLYVDPEIYGMSNRVDGIKPSNSAGQWRSLYWNIHEWKPKG